MREQVAAGHDRARRVGRRPVADLRHVRLHRRPGRLGGAQLHQDAGGGGGSDPEGGAEHHLWRLGAGMGERAVATLNIIDTSDMPIQPTVSINYPRGF